MYRRPVHGGEGARSEGATLCLSSPRLAVLASGRGSILEALIEEGLGVVVVLVDRECRAAEVSERAGIAVERVVRESYGGSFDRDAYTSRVLRALDPHTPELVAMAGYGTVLGKELLDTYPGRVVNTHPALLPAFKGWHAVEDALAAGVPETGCTVHVATLEADEGPILAQEAVTILPGESAASLHERIKAVERRLYPATLRKLMADLGLA